VGEVLEQLMGDAEGAVCTRAELFVTSKLCGHEGAKEHTPAGPWRGMRPAWTVLPPTPCRASTKALRPRPAGAAAACRAGRRTSPGGSRRRRRRRSLRAAGLARPCASRAQTERDAHPTRGITVSFGRAARVSWEVVGVKGVL
jgi:hypothetical protein